ncbi:uncharacterized protein PRCAT00003477001 [Priceomyces carsonii]|uniref:uncharacterized protein n=1 Tax=Priceomyces carsonii TaxID=28549 RepID=UPI002EDADD8A|nr:unnamed protein product [Priceomyces carsonii]
MRSIGWTIEDWVKYHRHSSDEDSLSVLLELVMLQEASPEDPAWIALASKDSIIHQWNILKLKPQNKQLPLYGVPVAVKDSIDAYGFKTTVACPSYAYDAPKDATAVSLLRETGAIIIGKTNLDQFATGLVGTRSPYGATPNTFSPNHVSGGSSSGSASVVSRGIVPLALGSDTAGSGRVPAALNNIIGLKPSRGCVSYAGSVPACRTLDCISILTLNLQDAQLAFFILAKPDFANYEYSRPLPKNPLLRFRMTPRIAVPSKLFWFGEQENPKLFDKAVDTLRASGAETVLFDIKPLVELSRCLYEGPWVSERYSLLKDFFNSEPPLEDLNPITTSIIKEGSKYSAANAFEFEYKRQRILSDLNLHLENIDAIVVPTCPLNPTMAQVAEEPIKVNSYQGTYTNFVNLADLAGLAIPAGFRPDGLPFGITLLGKKFTDYALLDLAGRYMKIYSNHEGRRAGCTMKATLDRLLPLPTSNMNSQFKVAIVGQYQSDGDLHRQLLDLNAYFIGVEFTSSRYRLFAITRDDTYQDCLLRDVGPKCGKMISTEVYGIPRERYWDFAHLFRDTWKPCSIELSSGESVISFNCEETVLSRSTVLDITDFGSYKAYKKSHIQKAKIFEKVLVANRGEIAVRIIRTLQKLAIKSVAIYSETDKYAQHVLIADESILLGDSCTLETYLNIEKIISLAKKANAQAIIPGYGFLSENAEFAERCFDENLVFVGPSAESIRKLGLKHVARECAEKVGIPLVPGSELIYDMNEAKSVAKIIGFPVMAKSTAGGGGIGLQKVDSEQELETVIQLVRHLAGDYFGNSGVFLEKFIKKARHVEVQILGDGKGRAIALGERDCSVQRRNQKIIEETPAPKLPEKIRREMHDGACKLASMMNYKSAGTIEFLFIEEEQVFYFLEVNTRLQVEHPITEMVTGIDIVEWMIKIASDISLNFEKNFDIHGVSMEARVYAENPIKGFLPSPGELFEVNLPQWPRIDTWIKSGTIVTTDYDPTLAKIIVHGTDRSDALTKLQNALQETSLFGCATNIDYLQSVVTSKAFAGAQLSTTMLDSHHYKPSAFEVVAPGPFTTVQDYPGRVNYWKIGVPPSGCMDSYAFRMANSLVGNSEGASGLEATLSGPKLIFHGDSVISITGADCDVFLNEVKVDQWSRVIVKSGDNISIGKIRNGCRVYMAIQGGIEVPEYLGSRSTFVQGKIGGYNGRKLKIGDTLFFGDKKHAKFSSDPDKCRMTKLPSQLIPSYVSSEANPWIIHVTYGPHGAPDFFANADALFDHKWKVHYNSNRLGVRLLGPKPQWARLDGGTAGLHPSNTQDYVYSMGAINFTGDEPVIITNDGPSLGGFVCQAVVIEADMWKVGQVMPGDYIQFVPVTYFDAKDLKNHQEALIKYMSGTLEKDPKLIALPEQCILAKYSPTTNGPNVVYRQAGDRYILMEYGDNEVDLNTSYRIHAFIEYINKNNVAGIVELSRGVRSILVEFDSNILQADLLETLQIVEKEIPFSTDWKVRSKLFRLPMAFEDSRTLDAVKRYKETIRAAAPWIPSNVDFLAELNQIERNDVKKILYSSRYMVLGLGDVFLGAPCAIPLDPRHRLLGTKYNPSRSYTPCGTVALGGNYLGIYAMDSPGGYQLVGRTLPIWNKLSIGDFSITGRPWLFSPFDQIKFYEVSESEINDYTERMNNGNFKLDIDEVDFDHFSYQHWIETESESIAEYKEKQKGCDKRLINLIKAPEEHLCSRAETSLKRDLGASVGIYSEFSGRLWKSLVSVGQFVQKGDSLLIIEAMKTEMNIVANETGVLVSMTFNNGDLIYAGDLVAQIEKEF